MKKAWKLVVSLLLAAAMMAPLPFAALATTPYQDLNAGKVYIVGSGEELVENKTEEHAPGYYDKGTYTNRNFDEAGNYYIKKQFDWTDAPTKSEGVITFTTRLTREPLTAVYAFTSCEGHGFTKAIAQKNIKYLIDHYDRVDLIWLNGTWRRNHWEPDLNGIKITEDVGKDNDLNGRADYIDILNGTLHGNEGISNVYWAKTHSAGISGVHWNRSIYSGLYAYLAGMNDGSGLSAIQNGTETITLSSCLRDVNLAAIYVSFDGLFDSRWAYPSGAPYNIISTSGEEGVLNYPTTKYDCWNLLYQYRQAGRYYSLGMDGSGTLNEFDFLTKISSENHQNTPEARAIRAESINNPDTVYYPMWNELLALANPSLLGNMLFNEDGTEKEGAVISAEGFPDGQLWNGVKRNTDYVEEIDINAPADQHLLRAYYRIKDPNKRFGFDYGYNQDFATLGVPVVGMTLEDTISDIFAIDTDKPAAVTMEAAPADGAVLNYTISGNKVTFSINNYKPDTELTFKIHVKVNDDNVTNYLDRWFDTNTSAKLAVAVGEDNPDNYDITSPKAHLERRNVTVAKIWDDNNNQDGIRPDSVKVTLYQQIGSGAKTVVTRTDNPKTLNADNRYTTTYEPASASVTGASGTITITNKHTPETMDVTATKTWNDNDNQDGIRPDSVEVTLYQQIGSGTKMKVTRTDNPKTLNADNRWAYTWTGLAEKSNGTDIVYSVEESAVRGYEAPTYTPATVSGASGTIKVTNKHTPETMDVTATKTWNDNDNQDGIRPASIVLTLSGKYTVEGTEKSVTIADAEVTITPDNGVWPSHTWANLPKKQEG